MKRTIITTLGVLAAVAGFSNAVQARPAGDLNPKTENYTLSRNSSLNFESRTVQDDYRKFFGVENPTNLAINGSQQGNSLAQGYELFSPEINGWQVDEDVTLYVDEPFAPVADAIPFEQNRAENDRVEVQTDLIN